jgi:hypothetical protein
MSCLPLKYLGVPLHLKKNEKRRPSTNFRLDKLIKRIAGWRGKLLPYMSRLVLIKSCLASVPIYLLSFIKFSKWAIKLIESHMSHCLWNDDEASHKYHLAS